MEDIDYMKGWILLTTTLNVGEEISKREINASASNQETYLVRMKVLKGRRSLK